MTPEEAKRKQDQLAEHYDLSHWYGTDCVKCCGVYPKLITQIGGLADLCAYECEVCGKRTVPCVMPWVARDAWNKGEFEVSQGKLF